MEFFIKDFFSKCDQISRNCLPFIKTIDTGILTSALLKCLSNPLHCVKSVPIQSFSGPCFPAFELNTEYLSVFGPNVGKQVPEKLRIRTLFTQCQWCSQ